MKILLLSSFLYFSCGFILAQNIFPYLENDKYGFCDAEGNVVISSDYQEVTLFDINGFANVRKDTLWSLIDKSGKICLPFQSAEKYVTQPILNVIGKDRDKYEKRKFVKDYFTTHTEKDYGHFWLLNIKKKRQEGYFLKGSQHIPISTNYYQHYDSNFRNSYLITLDKDNLQSAFDTLGNVFLDKVKDIHRLNQRFFSYNDQNSNKLYDAQMKKAFHLPYRNIKATKNDTCFIVSNALEDSIGLPLRDTIKIVNQFNDIFFAAYLKNIYALSPSHYCHYGYSNNCDIDSTFIIKIKHKTVQKSVHKYIYSIDNQYIAIAKKGNTKIIDYDENIIFEGKYDKITSPHHFFDEPSKNYYQFNIGNKAGILDSAFNLIFQFKAGSVDKTAIPDFYLFRRNCQDGIVNHKGKIIIPAEYHDIYLLDNQFFKVRAIRKNDEREKLGLFSLTGKMLLKPIYDEVYASKIKGKTYFKAQVGKLYLCFDENGTKMSNSTFASNSAYISDEPIQIERSPYPSDSSTIYDRFGNVLETSNLPIYSQKIMVRSDSSVFYLITKGDYSRERVSTLIDAEGNAICNKNQTVSSYFSEQHLIYGLFVIQENGREKVINHKKIDILFFDNQVITEINSRYFVVKRNEQYFFYTHDGKLINEKGYDDIQQGCCPTELKYVALNIPNKTFQEKRYNYYTKKDTIITSNHKNYGLINQFGALVIPMIYNNVPSISANLLCVSQGFEEGNKTSFILDTLGNTILKTDYDNLKIIVEDSDARKVIFEAKKAGKAKLIDLEGKENFKMKYKSISRFWDTILFRVEDEKGEKIVNFRDEFISNLDGFGVDVYMNYHPTILYKDKIYILRLKEKTFLINLNGDIVKTFDTAQTRYVFERGPGIQMHYDKAEDNPNYINRELLEIKKDNQTWYYNLETLKEYKK